MRGILGTVMFLLCIETVCVFHFMEIGIWKWSAVLPILCSMVWGYILLKDINSHSDDLQMAKSGPKTPLEKGLIKRANKKHLPIIFTDLIFIDVYLGITFLILKDTWYL